MRIKFYWYLTEKDLETSNIKNEILDFLKDIIIIVVVVMLVKTLFVSPFQIKWQSMYDSYYDGQFIIVDRFSYLKFWNIKKWEPNRGDVVVFRPQIDPNNTGLWSEVKSNFRLKSSEEKEFFIKRIIGIPGDTLKIEEGKVFLKIEGQSEFAELNEWYLWESNANSTYVSGNNNTKQNIYEVPNESYFVMWDNRTGSTDSRACFFSCLTEGSSHFIKKDNISGKLLLDLGYFNLKDLSFTHPKLLIDTFPTFFSSPDSYDYNVQ